MEDVRILPCLASLLLVASAGFARAAEPRAVPLPGLLTPRPLGATSTALYFRAVQPGETERLWQTAGTHATTHPVWDAEGSELESPRMLGVRNEWLYFAAKSVDAGAPAESMYRTDGAVVERLAEVSASRAFAGADRTFFTVAEDSEHEALWVSVDAGVADTTVRLVREAPALALGSRLLYAGPGAQPWHTDGSDAGTQPLRTSGTDTGLGAFAAVGAFGTFFSTSATAASLWRTDGNAAGTSLVKSWSTDAGASARDAVGFGRRLYFRARMNDAPWALWTSDGTAGGTVALALLDDGELESPMLGAGSTFFFVAKYGTGSALYRTDGTGAHTAMVVPHAVTALTALGDRVYFPVDDQHLGGTDGTVAGTRTLQLPEAVGHVEGAAGIFAVVAHSLYYTTSSDDGATAQLWSLELPAPGAAGGGDGDAGTATLDAGAESAESAEPDGGCDCNDSKSVWWPLLGLFGLVFAQRAAALPHKK